MPSPDVCKQPVAVSLNLCLACRLDERQESVNGPGGYVQAGLAEGAEVGSLKAA